MNVIKMMCAGTSEWTGITFGYCCIELSRPLSLSTSRTWRRKSARSARSCNDYGRVCTILRGQRLVMDHSEAIREMLAEKYLLDELSPEARETFEEHFFGCMECAQDVGSGATLIGGMKDVLAEEPARAGAVDRQEPCELFEIDVGGEHTAGAAVGVGKCKFAGGERTNDHGASWGRISAVCEYSAG
ncbi:MAG: hypothetical protein DMG93_15315 [Acidobacteria bacterium]|nr:MAG: hypothetical protein DMG93_15315 [Acidobacteriota bacterium]